MRGEKAMRRIPLVVLILAPLVVLGAAGEIPLDQLTAASMHHVFHIVLLVVAFAVFAVFVAYDISKHGWPTFSWRLNAIPD
jgi:Na+/H+-dicarboxylate symporter